jgi:hypothetical protein
MTDSPTARRGPYEYTRFSPNITLSSGGPIFLEHNHAPAMGVMPDGQTLILSWFSTITEDGREPSYAFSTLRVGGSGGSECSNHLHASLCTHKRSHVLSRVTIYLDCQHTLLCSVG